VLGLYHVAMERNWERWLRGSSGPPPKKEDAKRIYTEERIKGAIAGHSELASLPLRVFAKGSFVNRTNISLESDVDIVVECGGQRTFFYYDLPHSALHLQPDLFGIAPRSTPCSNDQLKAWIADALTESFGHDAVTEGPVALKVRNGRMRLSADVVPAFCYHRYLGFQESTPVWLSGQMLFPDNGVPVHNWPTQHYEQGVAKNSPERTNRRFKQMVRALKRLVVEMREAGRLPFELPSFFAESLVFNVPDECFGHENFSEDMQRVLIHIYNATTQGSAWSQWMEVNLVKTLFTDGQGWTTAEAAQLAASAYEWMGYS
jgi:hypothetical protein